MRWFPRRPKFFIIIILRWKVHPQKTINGKRNFKRSLSFPFVDKRNHYFLTKSFFVKLNLVFCMVEGLACFWKNQGTQRGYFGFSSDGDDRIGVKMPGTSNKTPINPLTNSRALKITDNIKWYNCKKTFSKRSLVVRYCRTTPPKVPS